MYTTVIGRTFLDAYNKRENSNYTAKDFFEEVFISFFYDHPKYLMTGGNSPLENPKIRWKKGEYPGKEERSGRIRKTIEKIENSPADASIAIGFPSLDLSATTSAQITDLSIKFNKDDIYLSWIGSGLGIGVYGGLILLFDHPEILLQTFDGWKYYRSYLNDKAYKKLRGNQITTWNGQWLSHLNSEDYFPEKPLLDFTDKAMQTNKSGEMEFFTQTWVKIILAISNVVKEKQILAYVYNLSQTNTTIGFIPINIYSILKPIYLYKKLFGENNYLKDANKIESLYGTAFGFATACQRGQIGIQALEPKGLRQYMTNNHGKIKMPNYTKANEEQIINYNTYITWVIAMLNNEKLWDLAGEVAINLISFIKADEKGKTSRKRPNAINEILEVKSKKQFLEALIPIMEETDDKEPFVKLGYEVNKMVSDNFPYFHTLIRFRYAEKNN